MELFGNNRASGAEFSDDKMYRYKLWRIWDEELLKVMFIGLNPSKANETSNDPTIRRCINFARSWGYGGMYMCNLFAYISTDPKKLNKSGEDITINNRILLETGTNYECGKVIFCWGAFKEAKERSKDIIELFHNPYCIAVTKDGIPRHPLYLPGNYKPINFKALIGK